jgi:hypothetical protein
MLPEANGTRTTVPGRELVRPARLLSSSGPLTNANIDGFFKDGYVVVRSLLPNELLERVQQARKGMEDNARNVIVVRFCYCLFNSNSQIVWLCDCSSENPGFLASEVLDYLCQLCLVT